MTQQPKGIHGKNCKRSSVLRLVGERPVRLDACIVDDVLKLNANGIETLGSCCGHGRYPKTIIAKTPMGEVREYFSQKLIPRSRRFYQRDNRGFYLIPETVQP